VGITGATAGHPPVLRRDSFVQRHSTSSAGKFTEEKNAGPPKKPVAQLS
jgi:hypothetical protein